MGVWPEKQSVKGSEEENTARETMARVKACQLTGSGTEAIAEHTIPSSIDVGHEHIMKKPPAES